MDILERHIEADRIRDRADALEADLTRLMVSMAGESMWARLARTSEVLDLK
jgi:hypothetical protein